MKTVVLFNAAVKYSFLSKKIKYLLALNFWMVVYSSDPCMVMSFLAISTPNQLVYMPHDDNLFFVPV